MVKNLRRYRHARGISQQKLADAVGVTQQSINRYENHQVEPDINLLIRFADFFDISLDDLTGHPSPGMTEEEQRLLQDYRRLKPQEKESIRLVIHNYLRKESYTK